MTVAIGDGPASPGSGLSTADTMQEQSPLMAKEQVAGSSPAVQPAATVASADHILTLVSSCVVNQRAFANTCGVPLGAHLDLQPSGALGLPRVAGRPPLRCNGCSGFMNVYCKTNLSKWVWKCNMCGSVNIDKEHLGPSSEVAIYPELLSEAVEYVSALAPGSATPGSVAPPLPPPDQQPRPHLVFAVDTSMEPHDVQAATEALLTLLSGPHLPPTTLVSLLTFDGCVAVHNLGTLRCSHVLPSGGAAGAAAAAAAASSGAAAASATPSYLNLQAAVQQLLDQDKGGGDEGRVLVSELQGCTAQLPRVLASLRSVQGDVPVRARARCLCSAVEAGLRLIAAAAALDLTRHHTLYGSRVVVLAGGPPTRGPGAVPLELIDQAVPEKGRSPENRALAAALDVGAALGSMAAKIGVAVDIWTSTATGINARLLTAIAHGSGGELMPQLVPPYHPHVSTANQQQQQQPSSSGPSTPNVHQPASTPSLNGSGASETGSSQPNLSHQPASQQYGGGDGEGPSGGFIGPLLARQLVSALNRRFGLDGRLDCYCSEGLRLVQWMGPLDTLKLDSDDASVAPGPDGRRAPSASSGPWRLSAAACGMVAVEAGRGASLRLEVTRDLLEVPSLVLQVALHFTDPGSRLRVVRVVTRKLHVVDSRAHFLRTVNPTAAAALLGKKAVLDAKKAGAFRDSRRAEEARYAVAAQLGLVAARCGVEVQASRGVLGFGARRLRQWPPELMPLAYALYHFQRGPILGPPGAPPPGTHPASAQSHLHSLWDSDLRLIGINSLLWSAWADAYRAMTPKLYAVLPTPNPTPAASGPAAVAPPALAALPCVSLAAVMARTVPLLLDIGTAVLVSPTEEPGHSHSHGDGAITPALLEAALAAAGCAPPLLTGSAAAAGGGSAGGVPPARRRVPVPSVVLALGAQAGGGWLASRLIPSHHDSYDEQALQHPQLQQLGPAVAAQLSKQLREGEATALATAAAAATAAGLPPAQAKQAAAAAAASFVTWCRSVNVQPFPLAP